MRPGGQAEAADIRPGDIIKEINRKPVGDKQAYVKALNSTSSEKAINVLIKRPGKGFIVVRLEK